MAHDAINRFSDKVRVLQDRVNVIEEKATLFTQLESEVAKLNNNKKNEYQLHY